MDLIDIFCFGGIYVVTILQRFNNAGIFLFGLCCLFFMLVTGINFRKSIRRKND